MPRSVRILDRWVLSWLIIMTDVAVGIGTGTYAAGHVICAQTRLPAAVLRVARPLSPPPDLVDCS